MDSKDWQFEIERAFDPVDPSSWFSGHLLRLIAKADGQNRERLRKGFPEHVAAYESWLRNDGKVRL